MKDGAQASHEYYMRLAIEQAKSAAKEGEVPVGAVALWDDGRVVGLGQNRREEGKCALCHAELEAIAMANGTLGGWRLHKCTLYVTLEPCPMCAGAILNSRIPLLVYGARDEKAGAYGSVFDINALPLNHKTEVISGVLEEECASLLKDFFLDLRQKKAKERAKKQESDQKNGSEPQAEPGSDLFKKDASPDEKS